jgi:4-hydroxy 2-oxovalerate aldolase
MTPCTVTPAAFRLTDSTLRDGSHAVATGSPSSRSPRSSRALDAAGVPVIEVSHGDGLGGSSFNYGFSGTDEMDLLEAAVAARTAARIAVLMLPGIGIREDLRRAPRSAPTSPGSPRTAPRPTSPNSTSGWPRSSGWRRSGS